MYLEHATWHGNTFATPLADERIRLGNLVNLPPAFAV